MSLLRYVGDNWTELAPQSVDAFTLSSRRRPGAGFVLGEARP